MLLKHITFNFWNCLLFYDLLSVEHQYKYKVQGHHVKMIQQPSYNKMMVLVR